MKLKENCYSHIMECFDANRFNCSKMMTPGDVTVMIMAVFHSHREDQKKQKKEEIQQRRSRFIPYVIHNNTGSPLWFMTATSTPSRLVVSSPVAVCT